MASLARVGVAPQGFRRGNAFLECGFGSPVRRAQHKARLEAMPKDEIGILGEGLVDGGQRIVEIAVKQLDRVFVSIEGAPVGSGNRNPAPVRQVHAVRSSAIGETGIKVLWSKCHED